MAQFRFWNFEDEDSTFSLSRWLLGILEPGLYRGFDFVPTSNMTLTLDHLTTGIKQTKLDQTVSNGVGALMTKQGVVVQEDDAIQLVVQPAHATLPRIDLVVINHEFVEIQGGATASYSVLPGTPSATPVPPALSQPQKQTILGELYLPAAAANLQAAGVKWTKNEPELAGRPKPIIPPNIALLDQVQTFTAHHAFQLLGFDTGTATYNAVDGRLTLSAKGIIFPLGSNVDNVVYQISDREDEEVIILEFASAAVIAHDTAGGGSSL